MASANANRPLPKPPLVTTPKVPLPSPHLPPPHLPSPHQEELEHKQNVSLSERKEEDFEAQIKQV